MSLCVDDMQRQNILRVFLFVVFFGIGAAALSISILCEDLLGYYRNRQLLETAEESLNRLKPLNADYDALLEQLRTDANAIRRIAPATLGVEPADANTAYPKVSAEQLAAAKKVLTEDSDGEVAGQPVPAWLGRCCGSPQRIILFFAGAFLVIISFVWFGPIKQTEQLE